MAIKATCNSCQQTFNARDELAGKRVKCPKCKARMMIPAAKSAAAAPAPVRAPSVDPMEALLEEANIGPVSRGGPICPDCAEFISPGDVICVACGFNLETGKKLRVSRGKEDGGGDTGLSDAEKIMRKAEEEINEVPINSDDQDFGDGGDSFLIAGVAGAILAIVVLIGLVIVFSMDEISKHYNSGFISFVASCGIWITMTIWITLVAFKSKPAHGIGCVLTAGLYCIMFGFMQGKTLLMPTIILLVALVVGAASGAYVSSAGVGPVESSLPVLFETFPIA